MTSNTGIGSAIGRAPVVFFQHGKLNLVLRHYYRGGLVAKLVSDWYLGRKLDNSRSFREWCLLRTMVNAGLPVPVPVAAHVWRQGFLYQADLITLQIENSLTLADYLMENHLTPELWQDVGKVIRRFHNCHIYHADLNARNILLQKNSESGALKIYLIDFDRGKIRKTGTVWQQSNLDRLKRSLDKFKLRSDRFDFNAADWSNLLDGYGE